MRFGQRAVPRLVSAVRGRPELPGVLAIAALLNLWALSTNGWANTFYSGAVRSMTTSWHDFLFASLDKTGLMTVDKPPLALWVQALSARIFGVNSLSILVPQALMGVAAAGLTYDLVRRSFGRPAGFAAGIALALTPIAVAISRHNNPDQLLILCCVAALWFAVRALEDGRTRWLVWCGVCVGLGFETKMAVALFVVPGIALAYLWIAPRGRVAALRQLTLGAVAMAAVGLAWPLLVTLTPAADRPWISGTSDNSIWSLIFNYNGVGRVTGQTGAPGAIGGGGGGGAFGGSTGVFRLLQSGLGDQGGWLIGFAIVAGIGLLVASRLRRSGPRSGWLIAVGGAFAVSAVVFSYASGIFHPYYVSFLAPWTAMAGRCRRRPGPVRRPAGADRRTAGDPRRRGHRVGRARQPERIAVVGQAAGDRRGRPGGARAREQALAAPADGLAGRDRGGAAGRAGHLGRPRRSATPPAARSLRVVPPALRWAASPGRAASSAPAAPAASAVGCTSRAGAASAVRPPEGPQAQALPVAAGCSGAPAPPWRRRRATPRPTAGGWSASRARRAPPWRSSPGTPTWPALVASRAARAR